VRAGKIMLKLDVYIFPVKKDIGPFSFDIEFFWPSSQDNFVKYKDFKLAGKLFVGIGEKVYKIKNAELRSFQYLPS
jgi:hypothetical protein